MGYIRDPGPDPEMLMLRLGELERPGRQAPRRCQQKVEGKPRGVAASL